MRRWIRQVLAAALPLLVLVSASCGGGGDNGSPPQDVQVAISPAAAAVPLNSSLTFTSAVVGAPTVPIVADTGAVRTANVVTITTTQAHGLSAGQRVTVLGVTNVLFIGTFTVASVPSTTTFTYAQTGADATSGGGTVANVTVNWFVNDVAGGNATVGTIATSGLYTAPTALPPPATATITASGAVRSSNVVTITTTADHNIRAGQIVMITGVTDTTFNGTFVVSVVPSPTTFSFSQSGSDATSGSGSISSTAVQVKAVSVADSTANAIAVVNISSGVSVSVAPSTGSVGTDETFVYMATVTTPPNVSQDVTWDVNNVAGGNSTVGTIVNTACPAGTATNVRCGLYTAPAAVPTSPTVTIRATAVADTSRSATASATIVAGADPTLTSINPGFTAQGSLFQDIHLTGTNFRSTSKVLVNGTDVGIAITFINNTLLRARIPASLLETSGVMTVDVQRQNGTLAMSTQNLTVEAVRPALVGTTPDSATQGDATVDVNFNGGYFNPMGSVTMEFNGQTRPGVPNNPRQFTVTLSASDFMNAGLFSVAVRNSGAAQPVAAANLAVKPNASSNGPSVLVASLPVGTLPSAVAMNTATGVAVVANTGSDSVSVINLDAMPPSVVATVSLPAGAAPTGVAVDNVRNLAVVANNGNNTISIIDLGAMPPAVTDTLNSPTPTGGSGPAKPVSVAANPLTGLAVVANDTTNAATVIDLNTKTVLGTVSGVSTGPRPRVSVEPRLNWAVITPGGGGTLSIVDLGRRSVVATVVLGQSVRGIGINTETDRAFLVDPSATVGTIFSVLDQSVTNVALEAGHVASAVNPLTDIGISVNSSTNMASFVDLRASARVRDQNNNPVMVPVGAGPVAVAVDPGSNQAVVVNETGGTVTILSLGNIRAPHIAQVSPASICVTASAPAAGCVAASDATLTVTGFGFVSGATVRLDGTALATTVVSGRQLAATVPTTMLASPRRYAVEVENGAGGPLSNVMGFSVLQAVAVGTAPRGVAIDAHRNLALVANSGSDDVSFVDLATGTVTQTVAVGDTPQAVAVLSRANRAVVTNRLTNSVSLLDLDAATVAGSVATGAEPTGVAVNDDTGQAVVANIGDNTVSVIDVVAGSVAATVTVDSRPVAVAIDPTRGLAAVANETGNTIAFVALTLINPSVSFRATGLQLPTGVAYDPFSDRFLAVASLANNLFIIDPGTGQVTQARVGINPTSLAYNFQSSTLATLNTASQTISVMDFQERRIRAILPISGSDRFALAIHPRTNLAVVSDAANNRILLVPLPR